MDKHKGKHPPGKVPGATNQAQASGTESKAPPLKKPSIRPKNEVLGTGHEVSGAWLHESEPTDPTSLDGARLPKVWYEVGASKHWLQNESGELRDGGTDMVKRRIKALNPGLSNPKRIQELLELGDAYLDHVGEKHLVRFCGPVGGYEAGEHTMNGSKVLVTTSPTILDATFGDNHMMRDYINRLLGKQAFHFHAWMKLSREALLGKDFRNAQVMVIAGDIDQGKSFFAKMVKFMLGGRQADPSQVLRGETTFNAHLFGAELLLWDDAGGKDDYAARRKSSDSLKQWVGNDEHECHPKGETPFILAPFWRILITVNDDRENLQVLPPIDRGIEDKIIILKTAGNAIEESTTATKEYGPYRRRLIASIPDYLGWLERDFVIPPEHLHQRFGVKAWQDPEILEKIQGFAPELRLLHMILEEIVGNEIQTATARQVETRLKAPGTSSVEREALSLLKGPGACGKYLARLCRSHPRVIRAAGKERIIKNDICVGSGVALYEIASREGFSGVKAPPPTRQK